MLLFLNVEKSKLTFRKSLFSVHDFIKNHGNIVFKKYAPVVKNPPASAGDIRNTGLILGLGSPLEGIATHSSVLAWRIPRTAWRAAVHRVTQNQTQRKQLSTHINIQKLKIARSVNKCYDEIFR